jgi:hypothetical protein
MGKHHGVIRERLALKRNLPRSRRVHFGEDVNLNKDLL